MHYVFFVVTFEYQMKFDISMKVEPAFFSDLLSRKHPFYIPIGHVPLLCFCVLVYVCGRNSMGFCEGNQGRSVSNQPRPNLEWAWKAAMFAIPVPFTGKRAGCLSGRNLKAKRLRHQSWFWGWWKWNGHLIAGFRIGKLTLLSTFVDFWRYW